MWRYLVGWGIILAVAVPVLVGGKFIVNWDRKRLTVDGRPPTPHAVVPYSVACLGVVAAFGVLAVLTAFAGELGRWAGL